MIPSEKIIAALTPFSLVLSEEQLKQINTYSEYLLEYNDKVNLTAIIDPEEIAIKHFADSIIPLAYEKMRQGAKLIDVGTGAGFPGVPIKIVRPDIDLTLLDSLNKRLLFLQTLSDKLGQNNRFIHARAEEAGINPELREKFDYATSRAVAQLAVLCEYCLPLVKVGGKMLALKGPDCSEELAAAQKAIKLLGGDVSDVREYNLDGAGGRTLIIIEKNAPSPKRYPRQRIKLSDKPL